MDTVECGRIYPNPTGNFIIVIPRRVDALIPPMLRFSLLVLQPPVVSSLELFSNLSILS